jgi:cobalt/nickel transport system permease protein
MHIPDGFLTPPVWATLDIICVPAVSLLARKAKAEVDELRIPLLGVMGAFVFAAQMINFPVGLGTSGHLVGGALLAIILGPAAAAMVMTAIIAIQALVFQDGGIVALGPNLLNMAFAGVFAGYLPFHYFGKRFPRGAIFAGAFLSVLVSALLALSELLLSGVKMPAGILWVSLALFAVSAILEGLITVAAIEAIQRLQPSWVRSGAGVRSPVFVTLAIAAVFLASLGITFASAAPDGIWSLAQHTGIANQAKSMFQTPLADYQIRGISSAWAAKAIAGLGGVVLMFVLCVLVARVVRHRGTAHVPGGGD